MTTRESKLLAILLAIGVLFSFLNRVAAQETASSALIAPGASVTKVADGFQFTEGPAADAKGDIYFSDVRGNKTYKWTIGQGLSTVREDSGNGNGLYFDSAGNLFVCESGNRRITRISPDGQLTVVADRYDGKRLNSPNDIWVHPSGGVYFSDPRFGSQEGVEQDGNNVFYVPRVGAPAQLAAGNLQAPNGVLGTADGTKLYIADHGPQGGAEETYVYDIRADGTLANRRLAAPEGSDGMTLDEHGNLYLTAAGVEVYSPDGRKIASIPVPEQPSNVTFGGPDRRTLFITARTGFYSLQMNVRGQ